MGVQATPNVKVVEKEEEVEVVVVVVVSQYRKNFPTLKIIKN